MQYPKTSQTIVLEEQHRRVRAVIKARARRHLDSPLSQWVRSEDRGVPRDLAKRSVRQLIEADFEELLSEPAVGIVKVRKLLELLERVGNTIPVGARKTATESTAAGRNGHHHDLDGHDWKRHVESLRRAGMEEIPLGRIAESFSALPRRLWNCPLGRFTELSLEEFRALPYLGRSRLAAVQNVVLYAANWAAVAEKGGVGFVTWQSPSIRAAVEWITKQLLDPALISIAEVRRNLVAPLVVQCELDLGIRIAAMVERTFESAASPGEEQLNRRVFDSTIVPRLRIHPNFARIQEVLSIRWPEGGALMNTLARNALWSQGNPSAVEFIKLAGELFYPRSRNPANQSDSLRATVY